MSDSIRNFDAFQKSLRNFESWLDGAVPGAMDVDFLCERRGHFLILEGKPWKNGVSAPYGQWLALKALAQLPQFRVYLVGEGSGSLYIATLHGALDPTVNRYKGQLGAWWPPERFVPTSPEGLRALASQWWAEASGEVQAA